MHVTRDQPTSRDILKNISNMSYDENKLNVIMLMVDSLSHSNAQRVMNRTYKFLKNDPSSVIMQVRFHFLLTLSKTFPSKQKPVQSKKNNVITFIQCYFNVIVLTLSMFFARWVFYMLFHSVVF